MLKEESKFIRSHERMPLGVKIDKEREQCNESEDADVVAKRNTQKRYIQ